MVCFTQNHEEQGEGISSLRMGTYNVVDEDMFSYNSRPPQHFPVTADVGDPVSLPNYEFTGNDSGNICACCMCILYFFALIACIYKGHIILLIYVNLYVFNIVG